MRQLIWIAPLALAACVEQDGSVSSEDVSAQAGFAFFQDNCAACHGTNAQGAGEVGVVLFQIPPDLTVLSANNGGEFPRDYVLVVIDGFERRDHFSVAMPEFGAADLGPTVIVERDGLGTPIPSKLLAVTTWLEEIQE